VESPLGGEPEGENRDGCVKEGETKKGGVKSLSAERTGGETKKVQGLFVRLKDAGGRFTDTDEGGRYSVEVEEGINSVFAVGGKKSDQSFGIRLIINTFNAGNAYFLVGFLEVCSHNRGVVGGHDEREGQHKIEISL